MSRRPILCFDFDGVIHDFCSGWVSEHIIPDGPKEGAAQAIRELYEDGCIILVFSCRSRTSQGRIAMRRWLEEHGIPFHEVCKDKPTADWYIDDHGMHFSNWNNCMTLLRETYVGKS